MKPIKVAQVVSVDTTNYYLNNLIDFSDTEMVKYIIITIGPEGEFTSEMKDRGLPVYVFKSSSIKEKIQAYFAIKRLLKEIHVDIVHAHLFLPSLIGLRAAKKNKIRRLTTRHHSDAIYKIASAFKRKIWIQLEKYVNKTTDHIIAPSRVVYDIVTRQEKVPVKKVSLIPYGQTTVRFSKVTGEAVKSVKKELQMTGTGINLAFVSRLTNHKGHAYLFKAFQKLLLTKPDTTLYLVGSGPIQDLLEKEAKELAIEKQVKFLGWRNDALVIMKAADVIVHPSLEDALSSAVIESVMLEKPIVATDISGVRDSLGDGQYGKIVEPANPESLYKGIVETINDLEGAVVKAKRGREYLLNYMSAKRVAEAYAAIYKNLKP